MTSVAAERLRAWMQREQKNQSDVADLVSARLGRKVSQSTIHRALTGTTPHGAIMSALSAIAGIAVEWWSETAPAEPEPAEEPSEGAA